MAIRLVRPLVTSNLHPRHSVAWCGTRQDSSQHVTHDHRGQLRDQREICARFVKFVRHHQRLAASSVLLQLDSSHISLAAASGVIQDTLSQAGLYDDVRRAVVFQNHVHLPVCALVEFKDYHKLVRGGSLRVGLPSTVPTAAHTRTFHIPVPRKPPSGDAGDDRFKLVHRDIPSPAGLLRMLQSCASVRDQMMTLHGATCLDEWGTRQRFFVAQALEDARLLGDRCQVFPFGSTVSGMGKQDSDLDLVLFDGYGQEATHHQLARQVREVARGLHTRTQGFLVREVIPHARVPIVKFTHAPTGLACDLCCEQDTSLPMAELLFVMGEWCEAARPLILTLHTWARHTSLTSDEPGLSFTMKNLVLTTMALFYLQQKGLLPTYNNLQAGTPPPPPHLTTTPDQLPDLLYGFFHYYHHFDYRSYSVHVGRGALVPKHGRATERLLNVQNPLNCIPYNIAYNVSGQQFNRFKQALEYALHKLDTHMDRKGDSDAWGIISLFQKSRINVKNIVEKHTHAAK